MKTRCKCVGDRALHCSSQHALTFPQYGSTLMRGTWMDRRHLLLGAAGGAMLLAASRALAQNAPDARLTIEYEHPGQPVPADFTGLSYETSVLAKPDYFGEAS